MTDIVKSTSDQWLESLESLFESTVFGIFKSRWPHQPMKKNIVGSLISMGFHASHSAMTKGLTNVILTDILWAISLALSQEIIIDRVDPLTGEEEVFVTNLVLSLLGPLCSRWLSVIEAMGSIQEREGQITSSWSKSQKEIPVSSNQISKFNDGPNDSLLQKRKNLSSNNNCENSPKNIVPLTSQEKLSPNVNKTMEEKRKMLASIFISRK